MFTDTRNDIDHNAYWLTIVKTWAAVLTVLILALAATIIYATKTGREHTTSRFKACVAADKQWVIDRNNNDICVKEVTP